MNNKYNIDKSLKEIIIGVEKNKFIPTELGITIYNFMNEHFNSIINITFSAELEKYLDKIAEGNANWITIIRNIYDTFSKTVDKLDTENNININNNKLLGKINNYYIYKGSGKYGPYVKTYKNNKWIYVSIKNISNITLDIAYKLLINKK